jgi:phage tail sheath protein FI
MATTTSYPGVYIEENATPAISVSHSPTSVPVFIGQFKGAGGTGLTAGQCIKINTWMEFSAKYSNDAAISVVVTSTPGTDPKYTYSSETTLNVNPGMELQHYFMNGGGPCYLLPLNDYKNDTERAGLVAAIQKYGDITLLVSVYTTTDERDAVYTSINDLLLGSSSYFLLADTQDPTKALSTFADLTAVYYPNVLVPSQWANRPSDNAIPVTGYSDSSGSNNVATLSDLHTINSSLYDQISADISSKLSTGSTSVPATAAMAGIYCATDRSRGVWKPPANVAMAGVTDVSARVSDSDQGTMNNNGINVIRHFVDKGIVPWGARTLAGKSSNSDTKWRYIPVRRLFNSAEADIKRAMQSLVFEPNNEPTWSKARNAIENYLYGLWRQGALAGATPEEAYFVQIGEDITMTADDITQGKMIAQVGMAAARPAEFIVLQFTQSVGL